MFAKIIIEQLVRYIEKNPEKVFELVEALVEFILREVAKAKLKAEQGK